MTTSDPEPAGVPEATGPGGLDVSVPADPGGPPFEGAAPRAVRVRLHIAYDGAGFHGWARQPGQRCVQEQIEAALRAALRVPGGVPVRAAVAGRTDAGVHAVGQVCHADLPLGSVGDGPGLAALQRRLNGILPADVRVRDLDLARPGFDARWSALWRRYEYVVADVPAAMDPRMRGHVLWHPRHLDVAAMQACVEPFLGEHDFVAFCRGRPGTSTVRTVLDIGWSRAGAGRTSPHPGAAVFAVRADAFCHSLVRALVGVSLAVGEGRWPVERPADLLAAARRVPDIATAPAHGLTLVEVGYPPDAQLGAQAERARRWRGGDLAG